MAVDAADADLKTRHRAMWSSGDYPLMVETFLLPLGPRLVDACAIDAGARVLDVASGTGNAAIPAARRGATVTASDLSPALLEAGAARPETAGLALDWVAADAENLPFEDASFDVVMSSIGVMFAPHHAAAADELARVCRPGGTIGLLSWTPEGMLGALFRTMRDFAATPPPGVQPPPLWGVDEHITEVFGAAGVTPSTERETVDFEFASVDEAVRHYADDFGPFVMARGALEPQGRWDEFAALVTRFNAADDGSATIRSDYIVITVER
jgi:SAM-dependent methyltransferase